MEKTIHHRLASASFKIATFRSMTNKNNARLRKSNKEDLKHACCELILRQSMFQERDVAWVRCVLMFTHVKCRSNSIIPN
jgi:hypothetical protein